MCLAQEDEAEAALALAHATLLDSAQAPVHELAALWYATATAHHALGDFDAMALAAERCHRLAQETGDPGWASNALSMHAMAELRGQRVEAALLDLARSEIALVAVDDPALRSWAHTGLGYAYLELRLYELAQPHFEAAVELDASPIPLDEAKTIDLMNLAELHLRWADELERALPHETAHLEADDHRTTGHQLALAAMHEAHRIGSTAMAGNCHALALCSRPRQEAAASVSELRSAYESPDHIDNQGGRAVVGSALARALWRADLPDEALVVAREAAELSSSANDWHIGASVRWLLVQMEYEAGLPGAKSGHDYARLLSQVLWQQRLSTLQGARAALDVESLRRETAAAERRALEDPLTRVGNRRALDHALAVQETDRLDDRRAELPCSMLMVDLDAFKAINDRYGHVLGDEVLCAVADAIQLAARTDDLVVRLGGDEFVVLARDTDESGASALAERIRAGIAALEVTTPEGVVRLTATVGVSTTGLDVGVGDLLEAADADMYRGKPVSEQERSIGPKG